MHRALGKIAKGLQTARAGTALEASVSGRTWLEAAYGGGSRQVHNSSAFAAQPALADESRWSVEPEPTRYTSSSRRTGVIAVKVGMPQAWDKWHVRIPLTVLWIDKCQVRLAFTMLVSDSHSRLMSSDHPFISAQDLCTLD